MDPETLAQVIAQAVAAALATTPATTPAPVASAPAAPRVASPFTATATGTSSSVVAEAMRLYPGDRGAQRAHVAVSMADGLTCSIDTTATLADGTTVPSALHGFTVHKAPGTACPGVRGIAKDATCPGVIRG
jgi:hypothetical protein